jgi:hypothetical protein
MKKYSLRALWLSAIAAVLTSCGGSGTTDESGSPTAFRIVPDTVGVTGAPPPVGAPSGTKGTCAVGGTTEVFVFGGTAPYRIDNTVPLYVRLNKTTLQAKGESFTVTFLGGCLDPGQVVVVDHLDRQVVLTLTNKEGT